MSPCTRSRRPHQPEPPDVQRADAVVQRAASCSMDEGRLRPSTMRCSRPGSPCSIVFGAGLPLGEPGSTQGPPACRRRHRPGKQRTHRPRRRGHRGPRGPAARPRGGTWLTVPVLHRPRRQRMVSARTTPQLTQRSTGPQACTGARSKLSVPTPRESPTPRACRSMTPDMFAGAASAGGSW